MIVFCFCYTIIDARVQIYCTLNVPKKDNHIFPALQQNAQVWTQVQILRLALCCEFFWLVNFYYDLFKIYYYLVFFET